MKRKTKKTVIYATSSRLLTMKYMMLPFRIFLPFFLCNPNNIPQQVISASLLFPFSGMEEDKEDKGGKKENWKLELTIKAGELQCQDMFYIQHHLEQHLFIYSYLKPQVNNGIQGRICSALPVNLITNIYLFIVN